MPLFQKEWNVLMKIELLVFLPYFFGIHPWQMCQMVCRKNDEQCHQKTKNAKLAMLTKDHLCNNFFCCLCSRPKSPVMQTHAELPEWWIEKCCL